VYDALEFVGKYRDVADPDDVLAFEGDPEREFMFRTASEAEVKRVGVHYDDHRLRRSYAVVQRSAPSIHTVFVFRRSIDGKGLT